MSSCKKLAIYRQNVNTCNEKLDEFTVRYIIREKKKGVKYKVIAKQMGVSERWVQKLWTWYKHTESNQLIYPKPWTDQRIVF